MISDRCYTYIVWNKHYNSTLVVHLSAAVSVTHIGWHYLVLSEHNRLIVPSLPVALWFVYMSTNKLDQWKRSKDDPNGSVVTDGLSQSSLVHYNVLIHMCRCWLGNTWCDTCASGRTSCCWWVGDTCKQNERRCMLEAWGIFLHPEQKELKPIDYKIYVLLAMWAYTCIRRSSFVPVQILVSV